MSHHHDGESFLLAIGTGDSMGVFTVTLFAISAGYEGLFVGVGAGNWSYLWNASGAHGFGAFFQWQFCAGEWPEGWRAEGFLTNLALLELFPIVLTTEVWLPPFATIS